MIRLRILFLVIFGAALVPMVGIVLTLGVETVTVRLPREENRLLEAARLKDGEYLSLSYRHSVELTRVEGRFKVGPGSELAAWQTRTASVGTGLPNAEPERTRFEDGWAIIDEGMRPLGRLRFFFMPLNRTELRLGPRPVDLAPLKAGSLLEIGVERPSLWTWLIWSLFQKPWPLKGETP